MFKRIIHLSFHGDDDYVDLGSSELIGSVALTLLRWLS